MLDVCCGSGGSALAAAEAVGPTGKVIAVDLAERLIALGEAKACQRRLDNHEFKAADMLALGYPDASFDVVICVFGIFFVPDMVAATKELWREPPRVCRRPFCLSYAALAVSSICA